MKIYTTKERRKKIPISSGRELKYVPVFYQGLNKVKKGDVIAINYHGQVTNDTYRQGRNYPYGYNLMFTHSLVLTTSVKRLTNKTIIEEITEAKGTNIDCQRHHHDYGDIFFYTFKKDYDKVLIVQRSRSASSSKHRTIRDYLTIDQGYGNMQVYWMKR